MPKKPGRYIVDEELEEVYKNTDIEELNHQAIFLVLKEIEWMEEMGFEGLDEIKEALRIPELIKIDINPSLRDVLTGA